MGEAAAYFSETYAEARERFCESAVAASAVSAVWSAPFEVVDPSGVAYAGRQGEALATDFAWLGAEDAPAALIVLSGVHGAEGLAGSGAQLALLDDLGPRLASERLGLLLAHAVNPWGCSHGRRCDHEGVDVMRNFLDFEQPLPEPSEVFKRFAWALSPEAVSGPRRWRADLAILWCVLRYGLRRLQQEVPVGQYAFPDAPFYGGAAPSWSRRMLEQALIARVGRDRKAVATIDLHTGLGARGEGVMLGEHLTRDEPSHQRAVAWWGADYEPEFHEPEIDPASGRPRAGARPTAYRVNGSMLRAVRERIFEDPSLASGVLEFGTVPPLDAMNAVRDDHALWSATRRQGLAAPDEDHPDTRAARRAMRAAFYPSDPVWRAAVARKTAEAVERAANGLLKALG